MRRKSEHVHEETLVIPSYFYWIHCFVTLTTGVIFVNGISFLSTLSRKIKLRTVGHIQTQSTELLSSAIIKLVKIMHGEDS